MRNFNSNKYYLLALIAFVVFTFNSFYSQTNKNTLNNKLRLAKSYEQAGDFERAKIIYKELLNAQPWNQSYLGGLNEIYLRLKEYDNSIDLLRPRLNQFPNNINTYGMLGATYYLMGDHKKGYDLWGSALNVKPDSQINYRIIANYAIANRAFEKAVEILKAGQQIASDPKIFSYDLANIYVANMNYKDATSEFCFILINQPTQLQVIEKRIMNYLNRQGAAESAIEAVIEYSSKNESLALKKLLSFLYMQNKMYAEALANIEELDETTNSDGAIIFNFAQDAFKNKEYSIASTAYNLVITKYPNSAFAPTARIRFARTSESALELKLLREKIIWKPYSYSDTTGSSEYEPIIKNYFELAELYDKNEIADEALYRIAVIKYTRQSKIQEAEKMFLQIEEKLPRTKYGEMALLMLANIYTEQGNLDKAKKYFTKVAWTKKTKAEVRKSAKFKLGQIEFWRGNFSESSKILSSISSNLSDNSANDAIELSMLINLMKQDSVNLLSFAHANFLAEQNKFSEAANEFKSLAENENIFMLNNIAKYKYAEMLLAMNRYDESIVELETLSDKEYANLFDDKSVFLLANVYQYGLKDNAKAVMEYKKLLEKYSNSLYFDRARQMINILNTNLGETI